MIKWPSGKLVRELPDEVRKRGTNFIPISMIG